MRKLLGLTLVLSGIACGGGGGEPPGDDAGRSPTDAAHGVDAPGHDAFVATTDVGTDAASACGHCPDGTTCGTANGIAVCRTASGIPRFTSVTVIVMENTSLSTLSGATNTPYLTGLAATAATASDYHGATHPSMPNYLALTSGMDSSHIGCDCDPMGSACSSFTCNTLIHSCGCPQTVMHIGDQLDAAGLPWRDYGEDMGDACNTTTAGSYAARHVPFLYYDNVQSNAARCAMRVVDYDLFDPVADPQAFAFIAPNLTDDMHDPFPAGSTNLANGDTWLASNVPPILAAPSYTSAGLLIIVWDEDDLSGVLAPDDPIPLFVLSPFAKDGGFVSSVHANHYSLLATIEDGLGLPRLGLASSAQPLSDFFPAD